MKYDDASWHYGADNFPEHLPPEAGAAHIACFVAWALISGLGGSLWTEEEIDDLKVLQQRELTPAVWFMRNCDGKFTDEDLSDLGNQFCLFYYSDDADFPQNYANDLQSLSKDYVEYGMPNDWPTFDRVKAIIDLRFEEWRNQNQKSGSGY